ncbi:MAG TPA: DUF1349 domain-containing protein [Clostridia bacterium]|nr:DUF1349 domain-containing protein [Clostridia bacterium]
MSPLTPVLPVLGQELLIPGMEGTEVVAGEPIVQISDLGLRPSLARKDFKAGQLIEIMIGEYQSAELAVEVFDRQGKKIEATVEEDLGKLTVKLPEGSAPGKYRLEVSIDGEILLNQDFSWGVLAINTNKSIYLPGDQTEFSLAVLDERGTMVCDADLELKIIKPDSTEEILSTENGKILVNPECQQHGYTQNPDYEAFFYPEDLGEYGLELTAKTKNGTHTIEDSFAVRKEVLFDVERKGPTRIFPPEQYPVRFNLQAYEDFEGIVEEIVPAGFEIMPTEEVLSYEKVEVKDDSQIISWELSFKKGEEVSFGYRFDAPDISPQFYLLGPLRFKSEIRSTKYETVFEEQRQWQVAVDDQNDVILLWDTANDPIPDGWACISCASTDPMYAVFPRAANTYGGATAGYDSHNGTQHSFAFSSQTDAAVGTAKGETGGIRVISQSHAHTWTDGLVIGSGDLRPPFKNLEMIKASNPSVIPPNVIGIFDTTSLPSDWTRYSALDGLYLRANGDNLTGGTQAHSHSVSVTSSTYSSDLTDTGKNGECANNHSHTISGSTSSVNNQPPYVNVVFAYNSSGDNTTLPVGLLAFFDNSSLPSGWEQVSDTDPYVNRFLVGASSGIGNTGGSAADHNHGGSVTIQSASGGPNVANMGNSGTYTSAIANHTHNVTYTIGSAGSLPAYRDIILAKYSPTTITVSGNIYTNETGSAYDCSGGNSKTVRVKINGLGVGYTGICSDNQGSYSVSNVIVGGSDVVTVYIDGGSIYATTVTKAANPPLDISSLPLYQNRIYLTHLDNGPITNTNLDKYDGGNDADIKFTVTSGVLTVSAGNKLVIASDKTYTPGGNIIAPSLGIGGTFNAGSNTVNIAGSGTSTTCTADPGTVMPLCNNGTFNKGTSTVSFTSDMSTTISALNFYNLEVKPGGSNPHTFGEGTVAVVNDLSMGGRTLWWGQNYQYRRTLTISAAVGNGISAGYSVKYTASGDTASQIYNASLSNGNDFRVVYYSDGIWTELNRDLVTFSSDSVEVWFKTQAVISGGNDDTNYYLFYGNSGAGTPPTGKAEVYSVYDDFNETKDAAWSWVREDPNYWSLSARPGYMRIITQNDQELYSSTAENILTRPADGAYELTTKVDYSPTGNYQRAALLNYQNDTNYIGTYRGYRGDQSPNQQAWAVNIDNADLSEVWSGQTATTTYLKVTKIGSTFTIFHSANGTSWTQVQSWAYVGSGGTNYYAIGGFNGGSIYPGEINADFDYVKARYLVSTEPTVSASDYSDYDISDTPTTVNASINSTILDVDGNLTIKENNTFIANSSNSFTIAGNFTNNGTFTANSGTVTFDAGITGETITTNGSAFNNLEFDNSDGGWTFQDATVVDDTLTVTNGTLDVSSQTLTLKGTGTPLVINGVFMPSTSTIKFTGQGATNINGITFNHLELSPGGGSPTYTLGTGVGQTVGANNLTIGNGTNAVAVSTTTNNPDVEITGDLIVNTSGTLSGTGTGTIMVNGNAKGGGTINLTGGTFDHRATASVGIGTTTGSNNWTFNDLIFSNSTPNVTRSTGPVLVEDNASDTFQPEGRHIVQTSAGVLYVITCSSGGKTVVKKSTDGSSWAEQDSGSSRDCYFNMPIGVAIDSSDTLHLIYPFDSMSSEKEYFTFSTATDSYGIGETVELNGRPTIAIDDNNVPHIAGSTSSAVVYNNRVGGSWKGSAITIEAVNANGGVVAIDESNNPVIVYENSTDDDLTIAGSSTNNPTQASDFTVHDVDTEILDAIGAYYPSVGIASDGDTWLGYIDSSSVPVLAHHDVASGWDSGWTIGIGNTANQGNYPSIAVVESTVFMLYQDDSTDSKVVYNAYDIDAETWAGEMVLETPGTGVDYQAPSLRYSSNNFHNSEYLDYLFFDDTNNDIYWNVLDSGASQDRSVTITANSGGLGNISVGGTMTVSQSSDSFVTTLDLETNDRDFDINGDVAIGDSGVMSASSTSNFTISGNFTNNGTFAANSGTVTFDDNTRTSNIWYGGVGSTQPFYNLFVTTAGKQMKFDETEMTGVGGSFYIQGTNCSDGRVFLDSTTDGDQWDIKVTGTADVDYADVEDSNAIVALTANNSTKDNEGNTNWTIYAGACGGANQNPNNPSNLGQLKTDNSIITAGTWVNVDSVKVGATVSDPDSSDTLYLCYEKDFIGTAFSDTEDACSGGTAYSGSPLSLSVTISGLSEEGYHWQVRVKDAANAYSSWVAFGDGVTQDFGVDTSPPTGGTVYDGSEEGVDKDFNDGSLSELSANWSGFDAQVSGLSYYEYSIGTTAGTTDVKVWTNIGTGNSASATGLSLQTSNIYFFNVRITDLAGNTAAVYSDGVQIAPTLSFSVSPAVQTFSNLGVGNSYTDTKNTTLTTSTNAYGGYLIWAYLSSLLTSAANPDDTVPLFDGGSYESPASWGAGNVGFGYTSSDTTIQGSDKFGGGTLYAPYSLVGAGDIIADHTDSVSGSPINNEEFAITSKIKVGETQAASTYATTIIYTATALY